MATALWVKTIRHHRTDLQTTVPCGRGNAHEALREACRLLKELAEESAWQR